MHQKINMKMAKISIKIQTNNVRIVSPNSAEMPAKPCLAITAVKPAKHIEITAYITQRSIFNSLIAG